MLRAAAAVALLLLLSGAQLADAARGGGLVGTPPLLLGSALAGYLVGLAARWPVAAGAVGLSATALTWAHQLESPGAYPVLDDFVFSLVAVGAPALAGAVVRGRSLQVRELRRLAALLAAQRETEVRAARLEERNRLEMRLHRGFSEQVAAIAMRTESAVGAEDATVKHALTEVEAASRQSLDELREALGSLREPAPAPPPAQGVAPGGVEPVGPRDVALAVATGAMLAVESVVSPSAQGPAVLAVAVALLTCAPLVVRRSHPVLATAGVVTGLVVMTAWLTPAAAMVTTILPVLVCGYVAGAHARGAARRALVLGVVLAGLAVIAWLSEPGELDPAGVLPVVVFLGVATVVGTVSAGWTTRAAELRATVAELERGREAEVGLAVAEQRNRLAGELHDTVAHAMTVICLQASAGQVSPDSARLDAILDTARSSLELLRNGLDNLGDDDELGLAEVSAQAARAGLHAEVSVHGRVDDLPHATRRLAARVVRESLTNAGRYAPGSRVRVEVVADDALRVSVMDEGATGRAVEGLGAGTGLRGLAGEVERSGGSMSWGRLGDGFRVEVTLPGSEVLV